MYLNLNTKIAHMDKQFPYTTLLDIRYAHQELIDVSDIANSVRDKWFNQTLTKVNDSVVRVGIKKR